MKYRLEQTRTNKCHLPRFSGLQNILRSPYESHASLDESKLE